MLFERDCTGKDQNLSGANILISNLDGCVAYLGVTGQSKERISKDGV
jgi:hypothetical protein